MRSTLLFSLALFFLIRFLAAGQTKQNSGELLSGYVIDSGGDTLQRTILLPGQGSFPLIKLQSEVWYLDSLTMKMVQLKADKARGFGFIFENHSVNFISVPYSMDDGNPSTRSSFVHVVQLGKIKTLYYYWEINSRKQRLARKKIHNEAQDIQPYGLVDNKLLFNGHKDYSTLDFYVLYRKGEDIVIPVEDNSARSKMMEAIRDCPELYRRINAGGYTFAPRDRVNWRRAMEIYNQDCM